MKNKYSLAQIFIYPIKSLGGIELKSWQVEMRGFKYDRRWMLVDENNKFISQRTCPSMSLLNVNLNDEGLKVYQINDERNSITIPYEPPDKYASKVEIWDDYVDAVHLSNNYDEWFSRALNYKCKLVQMNDKSVRLVDKKYSPGQSIVSFADAFPFLILGEASLNLLNNKLNQKTPVNRFRPNLVFAGGDAHDEDKWKTIRINQIRFSVVKPCSRCVITTIDQNTGEKSEEPLRTLSKYRKIGNKVMFGQNLIHDSGGVIETGQEITVEEWK